ncbi:hypothetical protein LTR95_008158 [Oleoguttula sp. CCFEE 5521]
MHGGWVAKVEFERKGKTYKTCNRCSDKKRGIYEKQKVTKVEAAPCSSQITLNLTTVDQATTKPCTKRKRSSETIATQQHANKIARRSTLLSGNVCSGHYHGPAVEPLMTLPYFQVGQEYARSEWMHSTEVPDLISDVWSSVDSGDSSQYVDSETDANEDSSIVMTPMVPNERSTQCSVVHSFPCLTDVQSLRELGNDIGLHKTSVEQTYCGHLSTTAGLRSPFMSSETACPSGTILEGNKNAFELDFNSVMFGELQRDISPLSAGANPPNERQNPHETNAEEINAHDTTSRLVEDPSYAIDMLSFGMGHVSLHSRPLLSSKRTWAASNRSIMPRWSPGMAPPMTTGLDDELINSRGSQNFPIEKAMWKLGPLLNNDRKLREEMISCVANGKAAGLEDILDTGRCSANQALSQDSKALRPDLLSVSEEMKDTYPELMTVLDLAIHLGDAKVIKMLVDRGNSSITTLRNATRMREAKLMDCVYQKDSQLLERLCNRNLRLVDDDCSASLAMVHAAIESADPRTVMVLQRCFSPSPRGDETLYNLVMAKLGASARQKMVHKVAALTLLLSVIAWEFVGPEAESVIPDLASLLSFGGDDAVRALIRNELVDATTVIRAFDAMKKDPRYGNGGALSSPARVEQILGLFRDTMRNGMAKLVTGGTHPLTIVRCFLEARPSPSRDICAKPGFVQMTRTGRFTAARSQGDKRPETTQYGFSAPRAPLPRDLPRLPAFLDPYNLSAYSPIPSMTRDGRTASLISCGGGTIPEDCAEEVHGSGEFEGAGVRGLPLLRRQRDLKALLNETERVSMPAEQ